MGIPRFNYYSLQLILKSKFSLLKTGAFLLLFFFSIPIFSFEIPTKLIQERAISQNLGSDPHWLSLIHFYKSAPQIADPKFYYDSENDSNEELKKTIAALAQDEEQRCRFPARSLWITKRLNLKKQSFEHCKLLQEFLAKAPTQKVSVVFASENITQASTIMGHILLKIEGQNHNNINVSHAISFYTELTDANLPRLVFQTLVTGKKGHYTLSPFEPIKNNYLYSEQRNLWEFQLNLPLFQQELFAFHLFELKNIDFKYFFHTFNCSTMIQDLLAVVFPEVQKSRSLWVTPLDVIRAIDHNKYIKARKVLPASKWKIRALQRALENAKKKSQVAKYLSLELTKSQSSLDYEEGKLDEEKWRNIESRINNDLKELNHQFSLDVSTYKTPSKTPPDSQLSLSYLSANKSNRYILEYIPASHEIVDDNSQYTNESQLKIFSPSFSWDQQRKKIALESFTLYSASSFQPSDNVLAVWSGRMELSYSHELNQDFQTEKGTSALASLGKTFRIHNDIDFFSLLGSGYKDSLDRFFINLEIGGIVREVANLKSVFSYTPYYMIHSKQGIRHELLIQQSFLLRKNITTVVDFTRIYFSNKSASKFEFKLKYLF